MTSFLTAARALTGLTLVLLLQACAQNPAADLPPTAAIAAQPASPSAETPLSAALTLVPMTARSPAATPASPGRFDQAWDVVELMGQPMPAGSQRPPRVVLQPQGGLLVDGGCNYFSGRIERNAQGLFRVSKYGGTHGGCEEPSRAEALLNSALMMADNFRWDRGLLLRSGDNELLRLQPSANQDSTELEQALQRRPVPAAAPVTAARVPAPAVCRPVKAAKPRKGSKAQAVQSCKPVKAAVKSSAAKARKAGKKPARPASKSGSKARSSSR